MHVHLAESKPPTLAESNTTVDSTTQSAHSLQRASQFDHTKAAVDRLNILLKHRTTKSFSPDLHQVFRQQFLKQVYKTWCKPCKMADSVSTIASDLLSRVQADIDDATDAQENPSVAAQQGKVLHHLRRILPLLEEHVKRTDRVAEIDALFVPEEEKEPTTDVPASTDQQQLNDSGQTEVAQYSSPEQIAHVEAMIQTAHLLRVRIQSLMDRVSPVVAAASSNGTLGVKETMDSVANDYELISLLVKTRGALLSIVAVLSQVATSTCIAHMIESTNSALVPVDSFRTENIAVAALPRARRMQSLVSEWDALLQRAADLVDHNVMITLGPFLLVSHPHGRNNSPMYKSLMEIKASHDSDNQQCIIAQKHVAVHLAAAAQRVDELEAAMEYAGPLRALRLFARQASPSDAGSSAGTSTSLSNAATAAVSLRFLATDLQKAANQDRVRITSLRGKVAAYSATSAEHREAGASQQGPAEKNAAEIAKQKENIDMARANNMQVACVAAEARFESIRAILQRLAVAVADAPAMDDASARSSTAKTATEAADTISAALFAGSGRDARGFCPPVGAGPESAGIPQKFVIEYGGSEASVHAHHRHVHNVHLLEFSNSFKFSDEQLGLRDLTMSALNLAYAQPGEPSATLEMQSARAREAMKRLANRRNALQHLKR